MFEIIEDKAMSSVARFAAALSIACLIGTFLFAFFGFQFWAKLPEAATVAARGYILIAMMTGGVLVWPIYLCLRKYGAAPKLD